MYLGFLDILREAAHSHLYVIALAQQQDYNQVVIRSPDSDIFHIFLHHAHQLGIRVMFDTGTGDKRRMLFVTELAGELCAKYCDCILGLYVFTGEDTNFTLKGKGKIIPLKRYKKSRDFNKHFADWETSVKWVMVLRMS